MAGDPSCTSSRVEIPTSSSSVSLPSDSISIPIDPPAQVALAHDRHASRRQFHHSHPQHQPATSEPLPPIQIHTSYQQQQLQNTHNNPLHGQHDARSTGTPLSPTTPMTAQTTSSRHLLLTDLRSLSNQETQRSTGYPNNRDSCETLKPSGSNPFFINESNGQEQRHDSRCIEETSVSPEPRLCRHPSRLRGSCYTRFFGFERRASTQSQVVVRSPWLPTGPLFVFRLMLFVYGFSVLVTDLARTERPRYSFCYLTQLSYLGLISYLGVSLRLLLL